MYEPDKRIKPLDGLLHPYFDELRDEGLVYPNGNLLPDLFNFSDLEIEGLHRDQLDILVPKWYRIQTGLFLSDDEEAEFNQENAFLNLDKLVKKRNQSHKKVQIPGQNAGSGAGSDAE